MNITAEKEMLYLVRHMDEYIEQMVYSVLEDSLEQPECSAVTACNLIKCYLKVLADCGIPHSYTTVKEYLAEKCFSLHEVELFEQKRASESVYYIGEQF